MATVLTTIFRLDSHYLVVRVHRIVRWMIRFLVPMLLIFSAWQKSSAGQGLMIPVAELSLAAWLVSGCAKHASFITVAIVFSAFSGVHIHSLLASQASCKCMGDLEISSKLMLLLTVAVVVIAVFLVGIETRKWRPVVILCFGCVGTTFLVATASFDERASILAQVHELGTVDDVGIVDPLAWRGQRLPLLDCLPVDCPLSTGAWTLIIVQPGCRKCQTYLMSSLRQTTTEQRRQEAIISLNRPGRAEIMHARSPVFELSRCTKEWYGETPIELLLVDGRVVSGQVVGDLQKDNLQ